MVAVEEEEHLLMVELIKLVVVHYMLVVAEVLVVVLQIQTWYHNLHPEEPQVPIQQVLVVPLEIVEPQLQEQVEPQEVQVQYVVMVVVVVVQTHQVLALLEEMVVLQAAEVGEEEQVQAQV